MSRSFQISVFLGGMLFAALAHAQTVSVVPGQVYGPNAQPPDTASYQNNLTHGQEAGPDASTQMQPTLVPGAEGPGSTSMVAPDSRPGTAIEQGYDPGALAAQKAAARAIADYHANNTPRQRGERIAIPAYRDTVANDPSSSEWLINWKGELVAAGVHPDKVDFEAGRLPKEQFSLWASRMIWALRGRDYAPEFDDAIPAASAPAATVCCQAGHY